MTVEHISVSYSLIIILQAEEGNLPYEDNMLGEKLRRKDGFNVHRMTVVILNLSWLTKYFT